MKENNDKMVIDVSALAYDLNAITDFIFQSNKNKDKTVVIKEQYVPSENGKGLILNGKEITETKTEESGGIASIRYDLVRTLIERANNIIINDFDDIDIEEITGQSDINATTPLLSTLGDTFAINTLLREGMLVKMDLNDLEDEK